MEISSTYKRMGTVAHAQYPSTWEAEPGGSPAVKTSLGYIMSARTTKTTESRACLSQNKPTKRGESFRSLQTPYLLPKELFVTSVVTPEVSLGWLLEAQEIPETAPEEPQAAAGH